MIVSKLLSFVLLVGYAVRCDDNNYYVIEMPEALPTHKPFKVYWNVPTKQCKSKKIPFSNLYEKFGIIQNAHDHFSGEKVTILYDPGLFPALLKNETSGRFKFRNGGVPQEGDLKKHLEAFEDQLGQSIPDRDFDGIGIIDFESWRPVFRQNFGVLRPYKDVSLEIERKLHWWWQKKWLEAEAKRRFEESARTFMQTTIAVAKQLRPRAQWGFYGFPYCFNMASNNMVEACASNVPAENDNISWLWRESSALYPSVYSSADLSPTQLTALIRGRVREAARFGRPILPYFWYRYRDAGFLRQEDLNAALDTLYKSNATGIIIWGSSSDVNTVQKCTNLFSYIEQVMGPAIAKYTKIRRIQNEIGNITTIAIETSSIADGNHKTDATKVSYDVATTASPTSTSTSDITNRIKDMDPEYHWIPPENYTQNIKEHVEEEISKKLTNYTRTENKNTVLDNNIFIDLILNSLIINTTSNSEEYTAIESNIDSETTKIGENNNSVDEFLSSSTTVATTVENEVLVDETTSISTNAVTNHVEETTQLEIETVSSTEVTKLIEATTHVDTHEGTSQNYDSLDKEVMEYVSTSSSPDKFTDDITDTSRSKNKKKGYPQDNIEDYINFTTEILPTTESTDFMSSVTEITENTTIFSEHTTEINLLNTKEDNFTQVSESGVKNIETTTEILYNKLGNTQDNSKTDETERLTTENEEFNQKHIETTTLKANNEAENYSSTTEPDWIVKVATEQNTSTKGPDCKGNNKTEHADFNEENTESMDYSSTKAPYLTRYTENHFSKKDPNPKAKNETENFGVEDSSTKEETSLAPTSTFPEQVVVYV